MDYELFHADKNNVRKDEMIEAIKSCGGTDCDVLYVHTDMTFGLPLLKRNHLLSEIMEVFENLGVGTIIFPTFTFSFCNAEDFDVQRSKTSMGAINEFIRKSGHGQRTRDPLLSVYVLGQPLNLLDNPGKYSIGPNSTYDRLRQSGKEVKFLFFGAQMWNCFTYTHYVEAMVGVPYRYNRQFSGNIVSDGVSTPAEAWLYSTYSNCRLSSEAVIYNHMRQMGSIYEKPLGNATLCCLREKDAWDSITALLDKDIYCLTDGTFDEASKDDTYNPSGERIISVK